MWQPSQKFKFTIDPNEEELIGALRFLVDERKEQETQASPKQVKELDEIKPAFRDLQGMPKTDFDKNRLRGDR